MEYNHCVLLTVLCIASAMLCESRENGQERTDGTFLQELTWRMSRDIGYVIEDVKVLIMMQEKQQDETKLMKEEMKKQHDEQRQLMKEEISSDIGYVIEDVKTVITMQEEQRDEIKQVQQQIQEEIKKQLDEQRQRIQQLQHEMKKQHDELLYGKAIVLLRRIDNKYDFATRPWLDYKTGFGDRNGSFWLGLEEMHRLTSRRDYALRIDLTAWDDTTAWARYETFYIAGEDDAYRITVGGYKGTAGDAMARTSHSINGMKFTTTDRDNDEWSNGHCATYYKAGWWYVNCHAHSQLTAPYYSEDRRTTSYGMRWDTWKGAYSYKKAEMTLVLR